MVNGNLNYYSITSKGERSINEDYIGLAKRNGSTVFILCDGLGGHGNGDKASQLVVKTLITLYESTDKSLEDCILEAQKTLLDTQIQLNARNSMKTTLVCLEIAGNKARFIHVGDSRGYYFDKKKYRLRTIDHSVPQMLVSMGKIKEKDIRHHEDRSHLLRVLGVEWDSPKFQITETIPVKSGTSFLLCSDGFWELILEKKMQAMLKKVNGPEAWLAMMEQEILKNGHGTNMDNYSCVAVMCM
ncbi:MAG: protein phosphatase 2C domain-containing protein [Lachnospiraceae bacterium]|nr:protein phosphatase 2C domain-containing protein [Lachnospiraceae bacterium]